MAGRGSRGHPRKAKHLFPNPCMRARTALASGTWRSAGGTSVPVRASGAAASTADTGAVLASLGMTASEIADLKTRGIV